jgi:hypothetical protein
MGGKRERYIGNEEREERGGVEGMREGGGRG